MWIFLDESGDLGFDLCKKGISPYFAITILVCDHKQAYDKIKTAVRRTLKNKLNNRKNNKRVIQNLKGEATATGIKKYFLSNFPEDGWRLNAVKIQKKFEILTSTSRINWKLCCHLIPGSISRMKYYMTIPDVRW